jgi:homoserine O-acetyltransferase
MSAYPTATHPGVATNVPLPTPFRLTAGGVLDGASVAVETYGRLAPDRSNAVLLFTGLSASAHARSHPDNPTDGWWERMIGPGCALDTERLFIISVNSLGSCFGSTGPGSSNPATGQPYGAQFPELRVEDIARASQAVVDALGITRLHAIVGASLGGMTVLAHAALFPGKARHLVSISGALAASSAAIATRSLQREIVGAALRRDASADAVREAMSWARRIGVLSYIGSDLLEQRFGRAPSTTEGPPLASGTEFAVERWLERSAAKFVSQFDPWAYWYLSRAMDLFDFADFGVPAGQPLGQAREGNLARAASRLRLESALVIGVREDILFPAAQQRAIASTLTGAGISTRHLELDSPYGHDAFLTETGLFQPPLRDFLGGSTHESCSFPGACTDQLALPG